MAAVVIAVVLFISVKSWPVSLLVSYVFLVLASTLLSRQAFEGMHFQPVLFWSYGEWEAQKEQVILNVIMFIPIGYLAGKLWGWKGLIAAVLLSGAIEVLQLITSRGLCEFDDIFHNGIGALTGYGIHIYARMYNAYGNRVKSVVS